MTDAPPAAGTREAVLGSGAGGPLAPPTPWTTEKDATSAYIQYPSGVVIGNPPGLNKGVGALNLQSIYLNGTQFLPANYLLLTGGVLSGKLILSGDPVVTDNANTAATKHYVDVLQSTMNSTFATYLPLIGGTVTGPIVLPADPTTPLQASTKQYVDTMFGSAGLTVPDAPADGTTYGRNNHGWSGTIDPGTY